MIRKIHGKLTEKDYLDLKGKYLFLQKKIAVCEDCFLQFLTFNEEKVAFEKKTTFLSKNTGKIAKKVDFKMKNERNLLENLLTEQRNCGFKEKNLIFMDKNTENPTENRLGNLGKKSSIFYEKNLENSIEKKPNFLDKKRYFKLNLSKIHKKIGSFGEYFNSERSTERISTRSRELTERYGNSHNYSEYFDGENRLIMKSISGIKRGKNVKNSLSQEFSESFKK